MLVAAMAASYTAAHDAVREPARGLARNRCPNRGWRINGASCRLYADPVPRFHRGFKASTPSWLVVMHTPKSNIMGRFTFSAPLRQHRPGRDRRGLRGGVILVDRSLIRRILKLQRVHAGGQRDFSQRFRLERPAARFSGATRSTIGRRHDSMIQHVERSTAELQSANELKSNFIRVAGHELRTPISYILGMARLLKDAMTRRGCFLASVDGLKAVG